MAAKHFGIGGNSITGFEDDGVAKVEVSDWHRFFCAARVQPARGFGREFQERAQGGSSLGAGFSFQEMSDADERKNGRSIHEIKMLMPAGEQPPNAVEE